VRALLATLAAAALGWSVSAHPELLAVDVPFSAALVLALLGGVLASAAILAVPAAGLSLLAAFVYLNLSQVLVRQHALPSLLQLLAVPLLVSAWRATAAEDRGRALVHPVVVLLALYTAFALASTAWARDPELAGWQVLELVKAFAVCVLAALLAISMRALRAAVWTLLASGGLLGLLAVIQAVLGGRAQLGGLARIKMAHIHGDLFEPRIAGPLGDPNFFAQVLVILVPLSLFMGWDARTPLARAAAHACGGLVTAAAVVTYSRGGALALGCVIALALLARREHLRQAAAGLLVFLALWPLLPGDFTRRLGTIGQMVGEEQELRPDSSFQKRRLLTQVAGRMFLEHPLIGVGAANYTTRFDEVAERVSFASRDYEEPGDAHYPHNLYLEVAAETGLVGAALFAGVLVATFAALRRAQFAFRARGDAAAAGLAVAIQIALAGHLVSSLFLHLSFPRYLWMLFGFAVALDLLSRREPEAEAEVHV
jgi:O-antigen ligase